MPSFGTFAHAGFGPDTKEKNCDSIVSGKRATQGCFNDESPLRDPKDASPAERKMLNGDSEGQPGPVPAGDPGDHGSSGCNDEDCERGE